MSKTFLFLGQTTAITKTGKGTTPDSLMLLKQKSLYSRDHQLIFCVEFGCRNSKLCPGILHEIFFNNFLLFDVRHSPYLLLTLNDRSIYPIWFSELPQKVSKL